MSTKTYKAPTTYGTAVTYLNKLFELCNDKYFDGELNKPTITIQSTPKKGNTQTLGHVTTAKVWEDGANGRTNYTHELNIGADSLNRSIEDIVATLIHEMVHLYCMENDIKDTSNNGVYHNKRFKTEAEKRGLVITKFDTKPSWGWTKTTPSEELIEWTKELNLVNFKIARNQTIKKKKAKGNSIKWTCPSCGTIVRSTKRLDFAPICGECFDVLGEIIHFEED